MLLHIRLDYQGPRKLENIGWAKPLIFFELLGISPSIRDGVLRSGMLLYLHRRDSKIFFHPAKFDNFKDEKISDFKAVSVLQRKNLLD